MNDRHLLADVAGPCYICTCNSFGKYPSDIYFIEDHKCHHTIQADIYCHKTNKVIKYEIHKIHAVLAGKFIPPFGPLFFSRPYKSCLILGPRRDDEYILIDINEYLKNIENCKPWDLYGSNFPRMLWNNLPNWVI